MQFSVNWDRLSHTDKSRLYMESVTPYFRGEGLYSDGTEDFRSPTEPKPGDEITLRIRTAKNNVDEVFLVYHIGARQYDPYAPEDEKTAAAAPNGIRRRLELESSDELFDYYATRITAGEKRITYHFEVLSGRLQYFYNRLGASSNLDPSGEFVVIPGFSTPEWSKGAVIYQILVDRFCNGDPTNDVVDREYAYIGMQAAQVQDWYSMPCPMDVNRFYGGDLAGVIQKLDYLADLGIEAIYFNPLFVSPSNHKYDIQDYDNIDPHYGVIVHDCDSRLEGWDMDNTHAARYITRVTDQANLDASNALFAHLVEEAHARGIKVIIDGVFNHCGSFNKWMDRERIYEGRQEYAKGAYVAQDSPYHNYFSFNGGGWPYNRSYEGWWGHDTLPKLNYEGSQELMDYMMKIARKWVSPPFNADGWRLDVAADLGHSTDFNHHFWQEFRRNVKEANPNAIILAEHYGDATDWLQGDQWDSLMNYDAFMEPITWFLTGMEKHSDERRPAMEGDYEIFGTAIRMNNLRFHLPSLMSAMNELSNHDHSRFLTRTNKTVGRISTLGCDAANRNTNRGLFRAAVLMQFTWIGSPTVYYGDEAGLCGWTDPDNRRTYPWGREDHELIDYHKKLIAIHKSSDVLRRGSLMMLDGGRYYLSYARFSRSEAWVVLINAGDTTFTVEVPVWRVGCGNGSRMAVVLQSTEAEVRTDLGSCETTDGRITIKLPPYSGTLLKKTEVER